MKKIILISLAVILLSSCQRGCQSLNKSFQTSSRNYEVIMYSGGEVVFKDTFKGIINENEKSDGIYYFKQDSLIQVSGDYVVKSVD